MSIFDDKNEARPSVIDWGKVGDFVEGTFIGVRRGIETRFGLNDLYELIVKEGQYHDRETGEVVVLKDGDVCGVWGRNDIFDGTMNRLRPGQRVGLKFTESKPSSKGNDSKIVKIFMDGTMNEAWLAQQQDVAGADSVQK